MKNPVDPADWTGVSVKSTDVGGHSKKGLSLVVDGVQYATKGEAIMARLLLDLGIAFTPNVKFVLKAAPGSKTPRSVVYVPDFIFDKKAFIWRNEDGSEEIVHGIEAKGAHAGHFTPKGREKVRLLRSQRGINVKLMSEDEIREFARQGALPMRPL